MRTTPLFFGDENGLRSYDTFVSKKIPEPDAFGHQVKMRRIACNVSQSELAAMLGCHQTTLSRIETGSPQVQITVDMQDLIERVLSSLEEGLRD